ncbi:MAG: hypothetical protein KJO36_09870 [Acidimicrobiia bacterium]|nr:hypothetical protein [Acidimicrobiia bacterium]
MNHRHAGIPDPTPELVDDCAREGYKVFAELVIDAPRWHERSDKIQDAWRSVARSMYGVIAVAGGAQEIKLSGRARKKGDK